MKCDNCGKNNANIKYLRNINGIKKEMNLCEKCSKELGIDNEMFDMPIDFSSFLGGFWEDFANQDLLPLIDPIDDVKCLGCNYTFEDIINTGKFGCPKCYETFETQIDDLLSKLHGNNRHVGRLGKHSEVKIDNNSKENRSNSSDAKVEENENSELENLKIKLKELVKEEKYEEAAKVRDQIKKLEE